MENMGNNKIYPVILCGGSGTRLWPVSRKSWPKQFVRLFSENSMLQEAIKLVDDRNLYEAPTLVSNDAFRFIIEDQLKAINSDTQRVILEPDSKDTAPAITLAAIALYKADPEACMLVLPSDHVVGKPDVFHQTVQSARKPAEAGELVTFGMRAETAETGYGYVKQGEPLKYSKNCYRVSQFIEKPDRETALSLIEEGGNHWNSGMFMFKVKKYIEKLALYHPEIVDHCYAAMRESIVQKPFIEPEKAHFEKSESISIDYALMERTSNSVVIVSEFKWSDVGSWNAVADLEQNNIDPQGNVKIGDGVFEDCEGTFIRSSGRLVTAIGLKDQVIVETDDAILVAPKDRVQDVKAVVGRLKVMGREEAENRSVVNRPWGSYEGINVGKSHQVKHIIVKPGEVLSLQYHHHRSEHWVVVSGTAEVTIGHEVRTLKENDSCYIPVGVTHRLHNPGTQPMHLIEIQYGDYLGEDDIVRLEDVYGRIPQEAQAAE